MSVQLLQGDCLALLPTLPAQSVDLVLADLPYGTTACKWDSVLPLDVLWREYKRVLKPRGAVVLTASQPFTTALINSNPEMFQYCLVWDKKFSGSFASARSRPLKTHEDVCVFAYGQTTYNPQMQQRDTPIYSGKRVEPGVFGGQTYDAPRKVYTEKFPTSIIYAPRELGRTQHPTQKPVALFAYLIRTYSNPDDLVLDNTAGSGTTGVAAIETGRRAILMERDPAYCEVITRRLAAAQPALLSAA